MAKSQTKYSLAIFIPVWNRGDIFKICFDSLIKNLNGIDAAIWIFDNGSDKETRKIIEGISSDKIRINKVFFSENMGIPYAANVFSRAIREDCDYTGYKSPQYVLIMDADAYFKNPVKDLIEIMSCGDYCDVGVISGHDSIEHSAIKTKSKKIRGKKVDFKLKENERMISMLMRKDEFLQCYPFPHYRNRDVDWEIAQWNPNSMMKRKRKIVVACGYVLHLGIGKTTWDKSGEVLASEEEIEEVNKILEESK